MNNIKLIAGSSNPDLANLISKELGIPLTKCILDKFGNTERRFQILENVRDHDVFIIQTGAYTDYTSINDYLVELLIMIDACKRSSAKSVNVIMPTYPYARSDKKDSPRVAIAGSMVAQILESLGVNRIIAMDLHAGQIAGFTKRPMDNLYAIKLHINNLRNKYFKNYSPEEINRKFILASPDNGGVKRVEAYAEKLKMDFVVLHKQRDHSQISKVVKSLLVGDPASIKDKIVILIDDMADTMGTMCSASDLLKKNGATECWAMVTHGIFSGAAFENLEKCENITKVIVTNTMPQGDNCKRSNKIEVVNTSALFAEVIKREITGESISELFN